MSRQVFWDPVLKKVGQDEELFTLKSMGSLSGRIRLCADGTFNLCLSACYSPDRWDQRLQKTDCRMINNTEVTLMRISSASMHRFLWVLKYKEEVINPYIN